MLMAYFFLLQLCNQQQNNRPWMCRLRTTFVPKNICNVFDLIRALNMDAIMHNNKPINPAPWFYIEGASYALYRHSSKGGLCCNRHTGELFLLLNKDAGEAINAWPNSKNYWTAEKNAMSCAEEKGAYQMSSRLSTTERKSLQKLFPNF